MIFDEDKERAVLGALMIHTSPDRYLAQLGEDDFTFEYGKVLLAAMKRLAVKRVPFDLRVTVQEAWHDTRAESMHDSLPGIALDCVRRAPTTVFLDSYIPDLLALTRRRRAKALADKLGAAAVDMGEDIQECLADAQEELRHISAAQGRWVDMPDMLGAYMDRLEKTAKGEAVYLPTGIADLDRAIDGFFPGEVTVLAARPAVGKSAMGAYIASRLARLGKRVAVCSLEMQPEQYLTRLIASETGVDSHKLRTGKGLTDKDWEAVGAAGGEMCGWNLPFTFSVRTIEDLEAEVLGRIDTHGLDLLVVDYMQLLWTKRKTANTTERLGAVSNGIKALAMRAKLPILALAQITRPPERGKLCMPTLDMLRGCGEIEQDADSVLFLHRPDSADDKDVDPRHKGAVEQMLKYGEAQYIVLNVAKNRNARTCQFGLRFDPKRMTYTCMPS